MKRNASWIRGLLTGAVAGAAGSLAMAGFQTLVAQSQTGARQAPAAGRENTTETTARAIAKHFGHSLNPGKKRLAGRALHYGFGMLMGAFYGIAAEYVPFVAIGAGIPFGTALFLGTDESVLPLLKLASEPSETPVTDHVLHLVSHVIYSASTELTRYSIVNALDDQG